MPNKIVRATILFLRNQVVLGGALLGAGLSAVGAYYGLGWLTLVGALVAALAALFISGLQSAANDKILEQAETIVSQATRIEQLITGGDGFAYIALSPTTNPNQLLIIAINHGEFPLYDVFARIADVTNVRPNMTGPELMALPDQNIEIGNMVGGAGVRTTSYVTFSANETVRNFNIFFNGRNGFWTQLERCRKINGNWVTATRVFRRGANDETEELFESIREGYPTQNGQVDWGR